MAASTTWPFPDAARSTNAEATGPISFNHMGRHGILAEAIHDEAARGDFVYVSETPRTLRFALDAVRASLDRIKNVF